MASEVDVTLSGKWFIYAPDQCEIDDDIVFGAGQILGRIEPGVYLARLVTHGQSVDSSILIVMDFDYIMRLWLFTDEQQWREEWDIAMEVRQTASSAPPFPPVVDHPVKRRRRKAETH